VKEMIDLYKLLTMIYAGAFPNCAQYAIISKEDIFRYLQVDSELKSSFIREMSKKYNLTCTRVKKELDVFAQIEVFEKYKKVQTKYENGEIDKKELYRLLFGEDSKYCSSKLTNYLAYYYKECLERQTLPSVPKKHEQLREKNAYDLAKRRTKKPMDKKLYWYISLYEQRKNYYRRNCKSNVS